MLEWKFVKHFGATIFIMTRLLEMLWSSQLWVQVHFLIFLFWLKDIESPYELGPFGKRLLVTMLLFCENTCGATIFMMTRLLEMLWSSQLWVQVHFLIFLFWLKDIDSPHELGPFGKRFLITMLLFCKNTCEWKNI